MQSGTVTTTCLNITPERTVNYCTEDESVEVNSTLNALNCLVAHRSSPSAWAQVKCLRFLTQRGIRQPSQHSWFWDWTSCEVASSVEKLRTYGKLLAPLHREWPVDNLVGKLYLKTFITVETSN
jgi:hypothetical protein